MNIIVLFLKGLFASIQTLRENSGILKLEPSRGCLEGWEFWESIELVTKSKFNQKLDYETVEKFDPSEYGTDEFLLSSKILNDIMSNFLADPSSVFIKAIRKDETSNEIVNEDQILFFNISLFEERCIFELFSVLPTKELIMRHYDKVLKPKLLKIKSIFEQNSYDGILINIMYEQEIMLDKSHTFDEMTDFLIRNYEYICNTQSKDFSEFKELENMDFETSYGILYKMSNRVNDLCNVADMINDWFNKKELQYTFYDLFEKCEAVYEKGYTFVFRKDGKIVNFKNNENYELIIKDNEHKIVDLNNTDFRILNNKLFLSLDDFKKYNIASVNLITKFGDGKDKSNN